MSAHVGSNKSILKLRIWGWEWRGLGGWNYQDTGLGERALHGESMTEICREFSWVFSWGQMITYLWGNYPKLGKEPPKRSRGNYFQGSQKARNSYCFHQPEQKMLKITEFISWRSWLVFIYHQQLAFKYPPKSTDCLLRLATAAFNSYRIESKRGCDGCFGGWETNYKVKRSQRGRANS